MILLCPNCNLRYKVDPTPFKKKDGLNVRCKSCSHVWFQKTEKPPKKPTPWFRIILCALVVLIIAMGSAGYFFRAPLVQKFPFLATYIEDIKNYSDVHLFKVGGLEVIQARYSFHDRAEGRVLIVQGRVMNTNSTEEALPPVIAKLFNAAGEVIYTWQLEADVNTIKANAHVDFIGQLMYPPEGTTQVAIEITP